MHLLKFMRYIACTIFILLSIENAIAVDTGLNGVTNRTIAVIVNNNDPHSKEIASYYKNVRMIPDENIVYVSFNNKNSSINRKEFSSLYKQVNDQIQDDIQAFVLTWAKPYKVECMSITSAFAMGFNETYCARGCKKTKKVNYYNSTSQTPYNDYGIRPTMMLAGKNIKDVKRLIDRGIASDYLRPKGDAYLLSTSDKERNVRSVIYPRIEKSLGKLINIAIEKKDYLSNKSDVLFYFTGLKDVKNLKSNRFLPGAIADHLTSTGGVLFNGRQMSVLKWVEAGVTGTYGTVVEPCNFLGKFPNPAIVMKNYLNGDTLIEAYWKSVKMPGQGLFVGEPLASPYKGCNLKLNNKAVFEYTVRYPKNYVLRSSANCN